MYRMRHHRRRRGKAPVDTGNVFKGAKLYVETNNTVTGPPWNHTYSRALEIQIDLQTKANNATDATIKATLQGRADQLKKITDTAFTVKYFDEKHRFTPAESDQAIETQIDRWFARVNYWGALPVVGCYALPTKSGLTGKGFQNDTTAGYYSADPNLTTAHARFRHWIDRYAKAIGATGLNAVFVIEPDGLSTSGLNTTDTDEHSIAEREASMRYVAESFRVNAPKCACYFDGLHSAWKTEDEKATRMKLLNVHKIRGFVTNISNFQWTADEEAENDRIAELVRTKYEAEGITYTPRYVIDTSRSGRGPITTLHTCQSGSTTSPGCCKPEWNPPAWAVTDFAGIALGPRPGHVFSSRPLCDSYFFAKIPGGSDEACGFDKFETVKDQALDNGTTSTVVTYPGPGGQIHSYRKNNGMAVAICENTPAGSNGY